LPPEFLPAGLKPNHLAFMRIVNPVNGATITGDIGDNIGRGGRKLIFFKDESAHYARPEMIEAALGDNTRVPIDISSVNGTGNVFHRRREAGVDWHRGAEIPRGKIRVLVLDWRDHPAKTQAWYDERRKSAEEGGLLHVLAQEVDRDYAAAVEGVIIPGPWVKAAIDAHIRLGFDDSGGWSAALDVADEGMDTNAIAKRKGVVLKAVSEWGERDTGVTTRRAIGAVEDLGAIELQYDCIGVGAGVKAEANRLIDDGLMPRSIELVPWNAGAGVLHPDKHVIEGDRKSPKNEDFFANLKAQGWWSLRTRFEKTFRAIRKLEGDKNEQTFTWTPDELISIDSAIPLLRKIEKELSQPTIGKGTRMKLVVDKTPQGTKSPNVADAIMMAFYPIPVRRPLVITNEVLAKASVPMRRKPLR
jgi:hypothetical protein